jgi:hypothetical protein
VRAGHALFELRSTIPGTLQSMDVPNRPTPEDAPRHPATLSLVAEAPGRVRRLPILYLGTAPLFGGRELGEILARLGETAVVVQESYRTATYALVACHLHDRPGIYASDLYNRSAERRAWSRYGVSFHERPFVRLDPEGRFHARGWPPFVPEFLILGNRSDESNGPTRAQLLLLLAALRLGPPTPRELHVLNRTLERLAILQDVQASSVIEAPAPT